MEFDILGKGLLESENISVPYSVQLNKKTVKTKKSSPILIFGVNFFNAVE